MPECWNDACVRNKHNDPYHRNRHGLTWFQSKEPHGAPLIVYPINRLQPDDVTVIVKQYGTIRLGYCGVDDVDDQIRSLKCLPNPPGHKKRGRDA